jgi:hypothetical protein
MALRDPSSQPDEETSTGHKAIAESLRLKTPEIEQAMLARMQGARAGVPNMAVECVESIHVAAIELLECCLDWMERGDMAAVILPRSIGRPARYAARTGAGIDAILRYYIAAHTVIGEFVMDSVGRLDRCAESGAAAVLRRVQADALEEVLVLVVEEFQDERSRAVLSASARRADMVRRLLAGEDLDGSGLDYDVEAPCHVALVVTGELQAEPTARALLGCHNTKHLIALPGDGTIWAWVGGARSVTTEEVVKLLAGAGCRGCVVGVGEPCSGVDGWRLSHRQADAACNLGLSSERGIIRYADDPLLAAAINDDVLARSLHDLYLAPLDRRKGGGAVLRDTLREYFAKSANVSSAAAALGVTRRTVEARLRTAEELLGRTVQACSAEIDVALRLDEIRHRKAGDTSAPSETMRPGTMRPISPGYTAVPVAI